MVLYIIYIILGFLLLVKGGDYLVDGSVAIAKHARLSNMVIGLTVIGFGTSAPELLVSTQAALMGSSGIAVGNVVGSNIANIALILGVTAIMFPIHVTRSTLLRDAPFMVLAVLLLTLVGYHGYIGRIAGVLFVLMLMGFVGWQIVESRKKISADETEEKVMSLFKAMLVVLVSFAALVGGSKLLVEGGVGIARQLGTSERIIGLTIVAVGTSLPELFATVMAARKKEADLALGNIIGSVTFNVLCVIGVASAVCPIENANIGFIFDYLVMSSLAVLLWLFLFTNRKLERWEGILLLIAYIAYLLRTIIL